MRMNAESLAVLMDNHFPYQPTAGQKQLIQKLSEFIFPAEKSEKDILFIACGFAGTGKTALISTLVKVMSKLKMETVLLAPTGRAAKVLSAYSGSHAVTVHKKIYAIRSSSDGTFHVVLQRNPHCRTLFIVDEASMIYDSYLSNEMDLFAGTRLLQDLLSYIGNGTDCRAVFLGDTAQLPPVGMDESPALNPEYLKASFHLQPRIYQLTEVVRQAESSGILQAATSVRNKIDSENYDFPVFTAQTGNDVIRLHGYDMEESLREAYSSSGYNGTLIICSTNKRANRFNSEIRRRILGYDSEIVAGDMLMCVRNNYYWLEEESKPGFIANGDIMEVCRVKKIHELYGFRFAEVIVRLTDYPDEPEHELKIMLDTLYLDSAALSAHDYRKLFDEVMNDYADIPRKRSRIKKVRENPYFNAVQVKFAYAMTCHKAQGGQWNYVFVEQPYLRDDKMTREYLRWLYTAVSRATEKLYLVNFHERFFP